MKRMLLLVAISGVIALFSSCSRSFTCECKTQAGVVPIELQDMKKSEAQTTCEKYATTQYATTGGCALQ